MQYIRTTLIICFFLLIHWLHYGQSPVVNLCEPFPSAISSGHYSFLSSDKRYIYILHSEAGQFKNLLAYNHQLQLVRQSDLSFLNNNFPLLIVQKDSVTNFVCETITDTATVYTLIQLQEEKITSREIATFSSDAGNRWMMMASKNNHYFLLYSVAGYGTDSILLNTVLLDKDFEVTDGQQFRFYLERQFDRMGELSLDDDGNIYTLISDRPLNYRIGSRVRIFKYNTVSGRMIRKEYYFKEKKPSDIRLTFSSSGKTIYLHALYVDFYTKNINGTVHGVLNENLELLTPFVYYDFDKNFKKQLNTYNSGVAAASLMNFLRLNAVSADSNGNTFARITLETDRLTLSSVTDGKNISSKNTSIMEEDPVMGILQREQLIRRQMGYRTPVRGRRFGGTSEPTMDYSEAYATVMGQRPDLFFMSSDTSGNTKTSAGFVRNKIYDRQLLFAFDKTAKTKWHCWYETEDQSILKRLPLIPTETEHDFVSVYYRHNSRGKTELAFTRVSKSDGSLYDMPLVLPAHITLLTTIPILKINTSQIAIFYLDASLNKAGIATLVW